MSTVLEPRPKRTFLARMASTIVIIIGVTFVAAGAGTWFVVSDTLSAEGITVSDNARFLGGEVVNGPLTAFAQADAINSDALEASNGKSYAELNRDSPKRETALTAATIRTALFTSVISFGIALIAIGIGAVAILLGWVSLSARGRAPLVHCYAPPTHEMA